MDDFSVRAGLHHHRVHHLVVGEMNLRLEAKDGITRIYNRDTGEEITGVTKVAFTHDGGSFPILEVTITDWQPQAKMDLAEREIPYVKGDGTPGVRFREFI